jgi:hypothetical protein
MRIITSGHGRSRKQAEASAAELRAVVPSSWTVEVHGSRGKPSDPSAFKVVAMADKGGLNIVCHGGNGQFYVHGMPEWIEVHARRMGDTGFETAQAAFDALTAKVKKVHSQMVTQFESITLAV